MDVLRVFLCILWARFNGDTIIFIKKDPGSTGRCNGDKINRFAC